MGGAKNNFAPPWRRHWGVVMSAVAVLKSSMSLFETCQMSLSEFRKNSRNHVDNTLLVYRSHCITIL